MRGANVIVLVSTSVWASVVWTKTLYNNIGHNLNTLRGIVFIFHLCIPWDKTFNNCTISCDLDLEL